MTTNVNEQWMKEAIELSRRNVSEGRGGPFAALIVRDDTVIARGTNQVTSANDPTAHAEIIAIRRASQALGSFSLHGCVIYTTCEPCPMCLGAIYWSRLERVFFANTREDAARIGFDDQRIYAEMSFPLSERTIPFIQVMQDAARVAFQEWELKNDKIRY
jgi:tRNA(Arg) A34 adenosine deaminase TadA